MHIEIYSREGCHYCDLAMELTIEQARKELVRCDEFTYDKYTLNHDFTRDEMIHRFPMATTYPQIVIDGEHIGGYQEYNEFITTIDYYTRYYENNEPRPVIEPEGSTS